MKHKSQGFTLIELMIVVAIIGILAAVAVPQYQNYTIRAKMSEAMSLLSGAKTSYSEYYAAEGTVPGDMGDLGISTTPPSTDIVVEITLASARSIAAELAAIGGDIAAGESLFLNATTAAGGISWTCSYGSYDSAYVPSNCR